LIEEPKRPYRHDDSQDVHHLSRPGAGALAHRIGNQDNESWRYLSELMATGCAKNVDHVFRGHASTLMHVSWGSLGAALASKEDFREYMDGLKWWFIMTETHDGGFVVIPGRDYASTDHVYGTRVFPTATAALILSIKDKQLHITGAYENSTGQKRARSTGSQRPPRSLIEGRRAFVDRGLMKALERLNSQKMLQPLLIDFSKARTKVWLKEIKGQKLVFSSGQGEHEAEFEYADLNNQDKVNLSRMAAQITPDNNGINVLAGIYLEIEGETELADAYYERADEKSKMLLKAVFEGL
jgi:hypothetical protein